MSNVLYAYRQGQLVGKFTKVEDGVVLDYAQGVQRPISLSLPVGVDNGKLKPMYWLENLLPDRPGVLGELAKLHNIRRSKFELLKKIGQDVAGDIVLIPEGFRPMAAGPKTEVTAEAIEAEIKKIKAKIGTVLPPFGERMSLAGAQAKFSLSLEGGKWYASTVDRPSTHIFKPGEVRLPYIEPLESLTLQLANRVGVRAAGSAVLRFGLSTSYATERFDRVQRQSMVQRVGQEDINQILGRKPGAKYQTTFKTIIDTLRERGLPESAIVEWHKQLIFNVHIGNYDAHTKNYSVMNTEQGFHMSPLYDSIPLIAYFPMISADGLAMPINGKRFSPDINRYDWQEHARACGLDEHKFDAMLTQVVSNIKGIAPEMFSSSGIPKDYLETIMTSSAGII